MTNITTKKKKVVEKIDIALMIQKRVIKMRSKAPIYLQPERILKESFKKKVHPTEQFLECSNSENRPYLIFIFSFLRWRIET